MARTFVSPMGDPTFATAATSLAEALFPNSRMKAAAAMAGAQYRGQQLGNEQTDLENVGLRDENDAWAAGPEGSGMTPEQYRVARMGRSGATPQGLADMVGKFLEQGFRQGARDKAVGGDYTGANGELFGVASGPVAVNSIDDGYQLNPYQAGSAATATGQTLAEIVSEQALAGSRIASAGASNALADRRRDEMANPGKYRTSGAGADISPSEAKALDDLVGYYFPDALPGADGKKLDAVIDDGLRNDVLTRAAELYRANGNAQQAVSMAVDELMDVTPGTPGEDGYLWDDEGEAPTVRRKAPAATAPAPAAAPQASAVPVCARNPQTGEVLELRNGQWVKVQ